MHQLSGFIHLTVTATIIKCNGSESENRRGFYFHNGEDPNSVLAGITITNGWAHRGSGIYCANSIPTITHCTISGNTASSYEGGYGGGIYYYSHIYPVLGNPEITNCIISDNNAVTGPSAGGDGGGVYCMCSASPTIANCIIRDNSPGAPGSGGGIFRSCPNATITNCAISENTASHGGGAAVYVSTAGSPITNCTFSANTAQRGGAVDIGGDGSNVSMLNCILWGDSAPDGPEVGSCDICPGWPPLLSISYSNVQGGKAAVYGSLGLDWGLGNIDTDPCFADPCDSDYHLQSQAGRWAPNSKTSVTDANTSLCLDAGNPGCLPGSEPPPNGNRINMGAFGGTAQASKTPASWRNIADLTNNWSVDFNDFDTFVYYWLDIGRCIPSDLNRDQFVDFLDFTTFGNNWQW